MKETKIIVNLNKNFIGHKAYLKMLALIKNVQIKNIKVEKNRIILDIVSSFENRDEFVKLISGKFNLFEVKSINYRY